MEKQKRWQFAVILTVLILTLYNILPTIIFYMKPLRDPITEPRAVAITEEIAERVNSLEKDAVEWIHAFCDLIQISPKAVKFQESDPSVIHVTCSTKEDAKRFRQLLPRAGLEIAFVPAQLALADHDADEAVDITVLRRQGFHFNKEDLKKLFHFSMKYTQDKEVASLYYELVRDRAVALVEAAVIQPLYQKWQLSEGSDEESSRELQSLADDIVLCAEVFQAKSPFTTRYMRSMAVSEADDRFDVRALMTKFDNEKKKISARIQAITQENKALAAKNELISQDQLELSQYLTTRVATLDRAKEIIAANVESMAAVIYPDSTAIRKELDDQRKKSKQIDQTYKLAVGQYNPFIEEIVIDWANDSVNIKLHADLNLVMAVQADSEQAHLQSEACNRLVMNEIARLGQLTQEKISSHQGEFQIALSRISGAKSFLTLPLSEVGKRLSEQTMTLIKSEWTPQHQDLAEPQFPRVSAEEMAQLGVREKKLCLVVLAPCFEDSKEQASEHVFSELRHGSIYVILRGVKSIMDQYQKAPESAEAKMFADDFSVLTSLLQKRGFIGYPGNSLGLSKELQSDYIFELADYYSMLLKATREDFTVLGSKKDAVLEFSDVEQRLLTRNKIEDTIQEDLLRWKEAYNTAQVDLNASRHYTIPKPTKNAFFENIKLSTRKYFRGDDRKILRWGLDLSGGKSVRIALVDHAGRYVEKPEQLKQAVNELYTRINKMGVSERTIRIENATVLLDFPGSQALSAQELVKASAMYFHVVNEQFGVLNKSLAKEVNHFLQEIWNEAVVTNRKDAEGINEIAFQKLALAAKEEAVIGGKSAGRILYEHGLRLANPKEDIASSSFNDTMSMIARFSVDDATEWANQAHPLMIVYHNYALEGSSLENIHTSYDPSKGNTLVFGVRSSYAQDVMSLETVKRGSNPRDDFYSWTAPFSEEKILGTAREAYSQGRGWRMAVILNGSVVSAPSLNSPLRDHAMITGHFSQREVSKLATDLSAGSLTFTPKILSEQNVSPELGHAERNQSIVAAFIAVAIVVGMMCGYYNFAGLVASVAVLFNILVIWAVMQNIDAVLTLPGIAGMVLTVGMAVDANVLVFERIREEFKLSGRIASSIQAGYKKAFSAIFDSNITTILVALILLQFDCGPIRGFAMTLIIGIAASMFTALFMTRYYFAGWVQNPRNKVLHMREWIRSHNFDFLKFTKPVVLASLGVFVVGLLAFLMNYKSMIGMDFTGGYSLVMELDTKASINTRDAVTEALISSGLSSQEFQVRELGRENLLRIQLATSLEEASRPFHGMADELQEGVFAYSYEKNPRIVWIVDALEHKGLSLRPSSMDTLANSWTVMSGQFSDVMRNNAILALICALVGVLVYIAFRFEWKYAVSSLLALLHDVLLTLAVACVAHQLGAPIQINLELVGAIMMIIGYSLNDTIIVFDRIREDIRLYRKLTFSEIINLALNLTLSRTILTSSTTCMVLVALVLFGSSSIFGFAFVMMTGVFLGTLSSLFIACPILLYLHNRDQIGRARE